jgi:hypothetical protein
VLTPDALLLRVPSPVTELWEHTVEMHLTVAILRLLLCAIKVTLLLARENNTAAAMVPCSPATAVRKDASTILPCTVGPVHRDRLVREIIGDLGES